MVGVGRGEGGSLFGFGMKTLVNFAEVGVGDVGVDLSGGDVGVAEKALDGAEVSAIHNEVGSKGVTKGVGGDVFGDAGDAGIFLNDALNRTGSKAAKIARGGDGLLVAGVVEEEGGESVGASIEVIADAVGGGLIDEDGAVFAAFTADDKFATVKVDGVAIEFAEFGDAEAAREEEFDDGAVAEAGFVGGAIVFFKRDGIDEALDFVEVEEGNLFFGGTRQIDEGGVK